MEEIESIKIPKWRDGIPIEDSILKTKLKNSKNFALTYLFLCERFQRKKLRITSRQVAINLKFSNSYAWQILSEFVKCGYLIKITSKSGKGNPSEFLPAVALTLFFNENFILEAKTHVSSGTH